MNTYLKFITVVFLSLICIQSKCQIPKYDSARGKWGYTSFREQYKFIIKPQFEEATRFVRGSAIVKEKGKYGIIDSKGKYIVKPTYDNVRPFSIYGTAIVQTNDKSGIVDIKGNVIIPIDYESISELTIKDSQILLATKDSLIYLFEHSGELLLQDGIKKAPEFNESGKAVVISSNGEGVISTKGQIIIPLRYAKITPLSSDKYLAKCHDSNAFEIITLSSGIIQNKGYKSLILEGDKYIIAEKEDGKTCYIDVFADSCDVDVQIYNNYLIAGTKLFDLKNGEIDLNKQGLIPENLQGSHYDLNKNLISWTHDKDLLVFNTDNNQFGINYNENLIWLPIGANFKKTFKDFVVYELNGNILIMRYDGKAIFENIKINDVKHLYKSYYAIFSKNKWKICTKEGEVFDPEFDEIKDADEYAYKESGYVSCDCSPGWYILFPIKNSDAYYVTGGFNYNEYGPFLDINTGLFGLVNRKGLTIKEKAHYQTEPNIPRGTRWLSGTFQYVNNSYYIMCTKLVFHPHGQTGGTLDMGIWQSGYRDWYWDYGIEYAIHGNQLRIGNNSGWTINSNKQTISINGEVYYKVSD